MIDAIRAMIRDRKYVITFHAMRRMEERGVSKAALITLIMNGDVIEEYPDRSPCPSVLMVSAVDCGYCHAVVALCKTHVRIVTVYWPDEDKWTAHRLRK